MKKIAFTILMGVFVCTGCMTHYDITLTNGSVITARGKPHLSADRNVWIFKDATGQEGHIPSGSVAQVSPQSLDDGGPTKFKPANR